MDIQRTIGGDIIMAFDECPPYPSDYKLCKKLHGAYTAGLQRCFKGLMKPPG